MIIPKNIFVCYFLLFTIRQIMPISNCNELRKTLRLFVTFYNNNEGCLCHCPHCEENAFSCAEHDAIVII